MNPQVTYGSGLLFQNINEDLSASLATADELSREFSSLLQQCTPAAESSPQKSSEFSTPSLQKPSDARYHSGPDKGGVTSSLSPVTQYSPSTTSQSDLSRYPMDSGAKFTMPTNASRLTPPQNPKNVYSPVSRTGSDSVFVYGQLTPPNQSPVTQRRRPVSPSPMTAYDTGSLQRPRGSSNNAALGPGSPAYDQMSRMTLQPQYDQMGLRSPRSERSSSPRPFATSSSSTLPRSFMPLKPSDEVVTRQKSPAQWNETDLDVSYERKPYHTYDKSEWVRPSLPNSNWRESNLDSSPPIIKKLQPGYSSIPRNTRMATERPSPLVAGRSSSPYNPQPIISRISIPPANTKPRQGRPIPLSVIMRLQNPQWSAAQMRYFQRLPIEEEPGPYQQQSLQPMPQRPPPELRQLVNYVEVLNQSDVEAELEKLDPGKARISQEVQDGPVQASEKEESEPAVPRPLSPTRLQPIIVPESVEISSQELLQLRAEIPRALKRRSSVDQAPALAKVPVLPSNQYKQIIKKLFGRKPIPPKGEVGLESSSSSEEEEIQSILPAPISPSTPTQVINEQKQGQTQSILRRPSRERKASGNRARLSPLVLLLDGSLVGEIDTVQRAVQEMNDPSQPNDEGITALHNAICGGHYDIVEFLVRIGGNVSAPDSHGWTPLHCAASCNDTALCEFLVRNGAAVMAVTESDGATASQKCDPYTEGFEECEKFLRGVEEAMGVENNGVLYALWGYPAQAADELSFREGDMVTILQKPERSDWWWASLCGREGFVPNNYFGLFPKVRPKSLC